MKIEINKLNTTCVFHDVNQGDELITRMACTHYFAFINAKYNGVIADFTENDIKISIEKAFSDGTFDYKKGGRLSDGIESVIRYLKEVKGVICNLATLYSDKEVEEMLDKGYAVGVGIGVNNKFYTDKQDGKLDLLDYVNYKGSIGHATNLIKWTCRGKFDCADNGKEMFLDSYFGKDSTYECNIKEVLEDIDYPTKYIIF